MFVQLKDNLIVDQIKACQVSMCSFSKKVLNINRLRELSIQLWAGACTQFTSPRCGFPHLIYNVKPGIFLRSFYQKLLIKPTETVIFV
jgi:hypothetical protein